MLLSGNLFGQARSGIKKEPTHQLLLAALMPLINSHISIPLTLAQDGSSVYRS